MLAEGGKGGSWRCCCCGSAVDALEVQFGSLMVVHVGVMVETRWQPSGGGSDAVLFRSDSGFEGDDLREQHGAEGYIVVGSVMLVRRMVEILRGAWVLETQLLTTSSTSSKPKNGIHLQIPILIVTSIKYGNSQV